MSPDRRGLDPAYFLACALALGAALVLVLIVHLAAGDSQAHVVCSRDAQCAR